MNYNDSDILFGLFSLIMLIFFWTIFRDPDGLSTFGKITKKIISFFGIGG